MGLAGQLHALIRKVHFSAHERRGVGRTRGAQPHQHLFRYTHCRVDFVPPVDIFAWGPRERKKESIDALWWYDGKRYADQQSQNAAKGRGAVGDGGRERGPGVDTESYSPHT